MKASIVGLSALALIGVASTTARAEMAKWVPFKNDAGEIAWNVSTLKPVTDSRGWRWIWVRTDAKPGGAAGQTFIFATDCKLLWSWSSDGGNTFAKPWLIGPDSIAFSTAEIACR